MCTAAGLPVDVLNLVLMCSVHHSNFVLAFLSVGNKIAVIENLGATLVRPLVHSMPLY